MKSGDRVRANNNAPKLLQGLEGVIIGPAISFDYNWRVQFDAPEMRRVGQGNRLMYETELDILPANLPDEHAVDCRSADGITIGLIDGIIAMARVLVTRDLGTEAVKAALEDFRTDDDVFCLLTGNTKE